MLALKDDIERYLSGRPVLATPDSELPLEADDDGTAGTGVVVGEAMEVQSLDE